jgi:hypothetical protein
MNHTFIAMWDCNGLEYLDDVTADEQRVAWERLQGKESPRHSLANPFHLRLRAQANPQRNYEIYLFSVENGISKEDLIEAFATDPQYIVDHIRKNGECFYSDRDTNKRVIA